MIEIRHSLLPHEFYIAAEPAILETLVGSWVAVCLYNYKRCIAVVNHFLHDCLAGDIPWKVRG